MISKIRRTIRLKKAKKYWDNRVNYIRNCINFDEEENADFKWSQLVWQEILMFIRVGNVIWHPDFKSLCDRRGFNIYQRQFLIDCLEHVGLWRY